jgi:hypothetical protein
MAGGKYNEVPGGENVTDQGSCSEGQAKELTCGLSIDTIVPYFDINWNHQFYFIIVRSFIIGTLLQILLNLSYQRG